MKVMNGLATGLAQDVLDLRAGKLNEQKATVISKLSGKAIKAVAQGAMLANHQEIQRDKVAVEHRVLDVKENHIKLQREKLTFKKTGK